MRLPGSPPPQCLSRCEAAGEEGGDAVMLVLQTRSKKQWTLPTCGDILRCDDIDIETLRAMMSVWFKKKLSSSQNKMERQVPDVFNVFALGEFQQILTNSKLADQCYC